MDALELQSEPADWARLARLVERHCRSVREVASEQATAEALVESAEQDLERVRDDLGRFALVAAARAA